jgi:hypothetical protein
LQAARRSPNEGAGGTGDVLGQGSAERGSGAVKRQQYTRI